MLTSAELNTHVRDNENVLKTSIDDNGHLKLPTYQFRTTDYTALTTDDVIGCSGTFTLSLYSISGNGGKFLAVFNFGSGEITIDADGGEVIHGYIGSAATTTTLALGPGQSVLLYTESTAWIVIGGSRPPVLRAVNATYEALRSDDVIICTSGTFTVSLFSASGNTSKILNIKNTGAGVITIAADGSEAIDGAASITIPQQYASVTLLSDGVNWHII